jgi:hypothetical protein
MAFACCRAEQVAKANEQAKKNKQPPRPRRVSICTDEQVLGVVVLPPHNNVNQPSSSSDKENQRPCPPLKPALLKPALINPYVTAKKPPRRAAATNELSPVDAYFDSMMEYSLGDDGPPAPASTLHRTTAQPPLPTTATPPTAAPTAALLLLVWLHLLHLLL